MKALLISIFGNPDAYMKRHPEQYGKQTQTKQEDKEDPDESELDLYLTTGEQGSEMFPKDHPEEF